MWSTGERERKARGRKKGGQIASVKTCSPHQPPTLDYSFCHTRQMSLYSELNSKRGRMMGDTGLVSANGRIPIDLAAALATQGRENDGDETYGNVVHTRVEQTYHVAPYEDQTWTHETPMYMPCFARDVSQGGREHFRGIDTHAHYHYLLSVVHVNAIIAKQFVDKLRQLLMDDPTILTFMDLPFETMLMEISREWRYAGICGTSKGYDSVIHNKSMSMERDVMVWTRGQDWCHNVWGEGTKHGDNLFFSLKYIEVKVPEYVFLLKPMEALVLPPYPRFPSGGKVFIPQFVGVVSRQNTLSPRLASYPLQHPEIRYPSPSITRVGLVLVNKGHEPAVFRANGRTENLEQNVAAVPIYNMVHCTRLSMLEINYFT